RVAAGVVIHLLHHTLLVLGLEQRQIRRNLQDRAVVPRRGLRAVALVLTAPIRQRRLRVLRRAAVRPGLLQQRRVVILRRPEWVGAHDFLARVVAIAEAPGGRARRIGADQRHFVRAPDLLEADGGIAAVVARVGPKLTIL